MCKKVVITADLSVALRAEIGFIAMNWWKFLELSVEESEPPGRANTPAPLPVTTSLLLAAAFSTANLSYQTPSRHDRWYSNRAFILSRFVEQRLTVLFE